MTIDLHVPSGPNPVRATLVGGGAVLLWACLALLTALSGQVPPFQLTAMSFTLAFLLALGKWTWRHENPLVHFRLPKRVWLLGVGGLFGYHFFYFLALRNAPAVEASLIAYLWPLLIVFLSALLPGERLRWWHVAGTLAGFAGTALLVTGGKVAFKSEYTLGYAAAIVCALTWSSYSVTSRRFRHVSTDSVGAFCLVTAILSALAHLAFETTVWPAGGTEWLAALGLGLGPVGAAFFLWDVGVKQGDIKVLGALSYGAPLLSTVILFAFGLAPATWTVAAACLLITGGAVLAAKEMLFRTR